MLTDLGFTYYDLNLPLLTIVADSACSCMNAVISGTPTIQNNSVSVKGQSTLIVSTEGLVDTVSQFVGITQAISNFCG